MLNMLYLFYNIFLTGASKVRKTKGQLMKNIDADYYGYRDEDDGVIVTLEAELEEKRELRITI